MEGWSIPDYAAKASNIVQKHKHPINEAIYEMSNNSGVWERKNEL